MRRPSRIGRILQWAGVAVCVLTLAVYPFTLRYYVLWQSDNGLYQMELTCGIVAVSWEGGPAYPTRNSNWSIGTYTDGIPRLEWAVKFESFNLFGKAIHSITIPLWVPFLLIAVPTLFLFIRIRRGKSPNRCAKCGYNLTGNVSGVCSECGWRVASP